MKNHFLFILTLSLSFETAAAGKMWVYFTDKDNSSQDKITLDDKTIERRKKIGITNTWYDRPVTENYITALEQSGAIIHRKSRWLNAVSVTADEGALNAISALPIVKKIIPVAVYKKKKLELTSSPLLSRKYTLEFLDYGFAQDQIEQINCHTAHEANYFGQGVRVLYIDTGYDLGHEAFDSLQLVAQYDFINNDENTANENEQEIADNQDSHGTLCLSVLAGFKPGSLIGPAFKSEFLLAKTEIVTDEIQQEEDNFVAGLEWGEANGADVACSSLGYLDWYSYCDMDGNTGVTTNAMDIAVSLGVVCVTSAGNWATPEPPPNPCDTLYYYISAPADADSVIAVGAVNSNGDIANFSSHGPTYDGRIKPEVCARGVSTWCVNSNSDSYQTASGTSLSAPLVGGAAAVVLSAHPDWTPMQVRDAFMMTADRADKPDNDYGYGVVDVMAAIEYDTSNVNDDMLPEEFSIIKVYPNPFNPSTTIWFRVETMHATSLQIYDITGQLVETLVDNIVNPGEYKIEWHANNMTSGIYFVQLIADDQQLAKKITLIK